MKKIEVTVRTVEFTTFRVEVEDGFDIHGATRVDIEELFDNDDWPETHAETGSWEVAEVFDKSVLYKNRRVQF